MATHIPSPALPVHIHRRQTPVLNDVGDNADDAFVFSRTPDDIRAASVRLSTMHPVTPASASAPASSPRGLITSPAVLRTPLRIVPERLYTIPASTPTSTPTSPAKTSPQTGPSGLSLLLARTEAEAESPTPDPSQTRPRELQDSDEDVNEPRPTIQSDGDGKATGENNSEDQSGAICTREDGKVDERTPLLHSSTSALSSSQAVSARDLERGQDECNDQQSLGWLQRSTLWTKIINIGKARGLTERKRIGTANSRSETDNMSFGSSPLPPSASGAVATALALTPHAKSSKPTRTFLRKLDSKHIVMDHIPTSAAISALLRLIVASVPAVLLGVLMNILDGVSYGMIMFPSSGVFADFGGVGVSMFFVTVIISQLVYSFGGSGFAGANGSMMIEVVPFFHILASRISADLSDDNADAEVKAQRIIATTLAAFMLSSILTGATFLALGRARLGTLIGFFPRHILVGCIGGVGVFLIQTGLAVCARIDEDAFTYSLDTLKLFLLDSHTVVLWVPAFVLAVLLRVITHRWDHQLIFPTYFLMIPVVFYAIVFIAKIDMNTLREGGWVFDIPSDSELGPGNGEAKTEAWYAFYSYFSWKDTSFRVLWATMPTQFALLFFNILHPPLNVPALAVSLNEDVDTNKELVGHGVSNLLAGLFGVVPNYLVYVNTLLFYRVGGTTRTAGFLLALATFVLLVVGTEPIGYIPIMLVGALIFVLGIDLVKEAVWDTRKRVSKSEYLTIASIMICMTLWDFVIGVLFGIVVCCFFFVVQNSRRRSVRAMFTGESAMSAVRRPSAQRDYIRQVGKQTVVLRLQGFLFFGTITQVEEAVRALVVPERWARSPVRFLVLDLTLVGGVDLSAAEAFVRIQRVLAARQATMVLCGIVARSPVARALVNVGLLEEEGVELFEGFSDAMEWTENAYLQAWYLSQKSEQGSSVRMAASTVPSQRIEPTTFNLDSPNESSPRRNEVVAITRRTLNKDIPSPTDTISSGLTSISESETVYQTLLRAFSSYGHPLPSKSACMSLLTSFKRTVVRAGTILWEQDASPDDGLYLIESGVLRAVYHFPGRSADVFEESMVSGTLAGELSALSGTPRNSTVVADMDAVLWRLSVEDLDKLAAEHPELWRTFTNLVLRVAKTDYDILLSALAARQ